MKFKVYKVTPKPGLNLGLKEKSLIYQLEVGEVRPGTSPVEPAVDYVQTHIPHKTVEGGSSPLMDAEGVHLTRWLVLDDTDIYWFIPGGRFKKQPEPIEVKGG